MIFRENPVKIPVWEKIRQSKPLLIQFNRATAGGTVIVHVVKGPPSLYSGLYQILVNRFVLVVVGVVFQPDVIHNIDGLILSALKYILSCYVLKWFLKTNYEIPWPSLLSYKWYLVCNQIGLQGLKDKSHEICKVNFRITGKGKF